MYVGDRAGLGTEPERQRAALPVERHPVDDVVVGGDDDLCRGRTYRDLDIVENFQYGVVARRAQRLGYDIPAARYVGFTDSTGCGGAFDAGADRPLGVVELANLFGREDGGELVHVVALDAGRGSDVVQLGFEGFALLGLAGSRCLGHLGVHGLCQFVAVGDVKCGELFALFPFQPEFADYLIAGRGVERFERLGADGRTFGVVDGSDGIQHGLPHGAIRRGCGAGRLYAAQDAEKEEDSFHGALVYNCWS